MKKQIKIKKDTLIPFYTKIIKIYIKYKSDKQI